MPPTNAEGTGYGWRAIHVWRYFKWEVGNVQTNLEKATNSHKSTKSEPCRRRWQNDTMVVLLDKDSTSI